MKFVNFFFLLLKSRSSCLLLLVYSCSKQEETLSLGLNISCRELPLILRFSSVDQNYFWANALPYPFHCVVYPWIQCRVERILYIFIPLYSLLFLFSFPSFRFSSRIELLQGDCGESVLSNLNLAIRTSPWIYSIWFKLHALNVTWAIEFQSITRCIRIKLWWQKFLDFFISFCCIVCAESETGFHDGNGQLRLHSHTRAFNIQLSMCEKCIISD